MFLEPPSAYEQQVIDHADIYQEVEKKWGKPVDLAVRSTYDPTTKKYFAFSDSYVPDPGNYRKDLWGEVGYPNGPATWDQLLDGARKIRKKTGNPCGLGLSQELDTSMASARLDVVLRRLGAGCERQCDHQFQTDHRSPEVHEGAVYGDGDTGGLHLGSFVQQPRHSGRPRLVRARTPSRSRARRKKTTPRCRKQIQLVKALRGPATALASEHVMSCYVIWNFANNKEGAKQFLVDLINDFPAAFKASEFYNFPSFTKTVPNLVQAGLERSDGLAA